MAYNGDTTQVKGENDCEPVVVDAAEVYLLMKEEYRISRNIRASWFLKNINTCISVKEDEELRNSKEELEILSVIPKGAVPDQQKSPGQRIQYRLLPTCRVTFLARRYRLVIVVDLSPSMSAVDVQSGNIHIAESHTALKNFLKGLIQPFSVPGSSIVLTPSLYVTVIAYTPLAQLTTQQVLVQGCLLTPENVDIFVSKIQTQLEDFENKIFQSTMRYCYPTISDLDGVNGWLSDGLDMEAGEDPSSPAQGVKGPTSPRPFPKVEMANPEATFVNMIWCGILALQLLPENTSAGIVVISDGVGAVPDALTLNNLLGTLRSSTTSCSFIQLGKGFYPHAAFGYVPHTEIMQFIATATFGAFLSRCPSIESLEERAMNQYHRAFLSWRFQKGLDGIKIDLIKGRQHQVISSESGWPESIQPSFSVNKQGLCTIPLIRKKHTNYTLLTGLENVLSVRLREGYTIKDACITKNGTCIEVRLALPWKYNARIEYIATAPWPLPTVRLMTVVDIIMEGSYEFLHDITCPMKEARKNPYRTKVVKKFWETLQSLRETDKLLVHLQSFATNPIYYTIPEGTKGGMPLFYMPPNSTTPVLAQLPPNAKDSGLDQFAAFWKRIALMDSKRWQRWLHTHRIALLLLPDMPLPKHLHVPNSSGRYASIQYRVALKEVNTLLKKRCTFIMLDNHSYIRLNFTESGGPPTSFYIIQVSTKTPLVLRLAFLGGTPGHERNKVVMELKNDLLELRMPKRKVPQYGYGKSHSATAVLGQKDSDSDSAPGRTKERCVVLLSRPIEMILMRYDKMPTDFTDLKTSIEVTATSVPVYVNSRAPSTSLNRLACYLHHRRWIWEAQSENGVQIATRAVANILDVLTKLRLQQGFYVAYSTSGILSFVLELKMKNPLASIMDTPNPNEQPEVDSAPIDADEKAEMTPPTEQPDGDSAPIDADEKAGTTPPTVQETYPCLLQYIVFPPHSATSKKDRATFVGDEEEEEVDDQDVSEADGRLQLVTECWVEPQSGTIFDPPDQCPFLGGLTYSQIPHVMLPMDQKIISALLCFEHLRVMCSSDVDASDMTTMSTQEGSTEGVSLGETIQRMPYGLDVLSLLPMCHQAQVLCSTFIPGEDEDGGARSGPRLRYPKPNDILFTLLIEYLKAMTNFQLDLSANDSLLFAQSVLARHQPDNPPPFGLTSADITELLSCRGKQGGARDEEKAAGDRTGVGGKGGGPSLGQEKKEIPKWTMFVQDVGKDHLILVFMPASYQDLQILNAKKEEDEEAPEQAPVPLELGSVKKPARRRSSHRKSSGDSESTTENIPTADGSTHANTPNPCAGRGPTRHSLPLPIFTYDCSLAGLTGQLLGQVDKSSAAVGSTVFKDLTFAALDAGAQVPSTPRTGGRHRTRGFSEQNDSFCPPAPEPKTSKALDWFCGRLSNQVHKVFVVGLFKSLQYGQWVDCHDVQAAIDWVCNEALYEVDITEFVQVACGHVYRVKAQADAAQQAADKLQRRIKFADQDDEETTSQRESPERTPRSEMKSSMAGRKPVGVTVPLDLLVTSDLGNHPQQCEVTLGQHSLVRERFTTVMGTHFRPVPSNKDIWFYHLKREGEEEEEGGDEEGGDGEEEEGVEGNDGRHKAGEDDDQVFMEGTESVTPEVFSSENPSEVNSMVDGLDDDRGNDFVDDEDDVEQDDYYRESNSLINSIAHVLARAGEDRSYDLLPGNGHSRRGSSEESVMGSEEEEASPLFVTLVCSVKLKTNVGHRTVRTIPTCLADLISCLESHPTEDFNLSDLSVTLDLMCLTLPPELDFSPDVGSSQLGEDGDEASRGPSLTEHYSPPASPRPDAPDYQLARANTLSTSEVGELVNDMMDLLGGLPEGQRKAIDETEKEVKWLLRDEIVSAMLHTKRVTVATLEMVAQHVEESKDKPNCRADELALQFVFGPEHSLAKFTSEFERLSFPRYQFSKVQDYWYLSLDQLHAETLRKGRALKTALESIANGQGQTQRGTGGTSREDQDGLIIPTTTIIYTPPSPEKHAVKRTEQATKGEQGTSKETGSKTEEGAEIEVGVDASQEIEDVEDEPTLEGVTIVEEDAVPLSSKMEQGSDALAESQPKAEEKTKDGEEKEVQKEKEEEVKKRDERGIEARTDGGEEDDGKDLKGGDEEEKVELEKHETAPRHAEDNVSRSSGSSIQILSEEPLLDDLSHLPVGAAHSEGVDHPDFPLPHLHKRCLSREQSGELEEEGEGSEEGGTLRRNSTSFVVLAREGEGGMPGDPGVESDLPSLQASPEHQAEFASSSTTTPIAETPTDHTTSPSPPLSPSPMATTPRSHQFPIPTPTSPPHPHPSSPTPCSPTHANSPSPSTTPGSPPRGRVGSGARRPTHSRQGSGGVSSCTSSLFQSYVSHSGSAGDNDEEGYDASSSDVDPEESHIFIDVFSHSMPEFWLILKLCRDRVKLFFHTRERNESERLVHQVEVKDKVSEAIKNTCKLVNQRLLLQELENNKTCSTLLVAESDEDIWKQEDADAISTRRMSDDEDSDDPEHGAKDDYLAAQMCFNQGHFACDRVLSVDLSVHSRLKPSHRPGVASRGLQALQTALGAFAVHDRKNLFVYKESSGEIFYLRLYESTIENTHQVSSRLCSIAESFHTLSQPNSLPASQSVSRATSNQSLNTIPGPMHIEEDSGSAAASSTAVSTLESRRDSGVDLQSISTMATSKVSSQYSVQHIISLHVFGVTNAGPEIKTALVDLLNKKLEAATLDVIADMLARNPLCKLTPDDVQFIQPRGKPPTESFMFTVPQWAVQYLYSVRYYLRQNLLQDQFLHPPKYIDTKPDHHFQDCTSWKARTGPGVSPGVGPGVSPAVGPGGLNQEPCEADVFLYNRPHKAEGGTGTACVATSLVDGCGNPVVLVDCPTPSSSSQMERLTTTDFNTLITTTLYEPPSLATPSKGPGPTALIQFCVWKRGSVVLAQQLQQVVKHALCDALTEYCVLTAPMAYIPGDQLRPRRDLPSPLGSPTIVRADSLSQKSTEPRKRPMSSPMNMKRSQSVTPGILAAASPSSGESTPSSAGPPGRGRRPLEGVSPIQSPSGSRPQTPTKHRLLFRDFSPKDPNLEGRTSWQIIEMDRRREEEAKERHREAEEGKIGVLHPMYSGLALKWFPFLDELDAPSVNVLTGSLAKRFSLPIFLQEFLEKLAKVCTDSTHMLYQAGGGEYRPYVPPPSKRQESDSSSYSQILPGDHKSFILIGRNVHQWRYSLDSSSMDEPLQPPNLTNPKSQKSFQQFDPLDLAFGSGDVSSHPSGLPGLRQAPQSLRLVVPRQRLLLLQATNREVKVYIYNWSNDKLSSVDKLFQRLVTWHNTRAHFLDCLVSQKMGLYQHCHFGSEQGDNPFSRSLEPIESLMKQPTLPSRDFSISRPQTSSSSSSTAASTTSSSSSRPAHMRKLHPALPPFNHTLQNARTKHPLQGASYRLVGDAVLRSGAQFGDVCRNTRKELEVQKELENLYKLWENLKRGTRSRPAVCKIAEDSLEVLKQRSRIVHYCATPLLFDPGWRSHVTWDGTGVVLADHMINPLTSAEAPWHNDLKNSMVSQYKDFLNTQGFQTVETVPFHIRPGGKLLRGGMGEQSSIKRFSIKRPHQSGVAGHLQMTSPGGIILIELSFRHTYFCVKLYSFETSRVPAGRTINKQLATRFTDDCDKYKDLIHIHSFSYDFHLRTIQTHLFKAEACFQSQIQSQFPAQYHVSSLLSCFLQYFSLPPHFRQYCIKKDTIQFLSLNTPAPQLYDYLVNHPNQNSPQSGSPAWRKLTMQPPRPVSSSASSTPEVGGLPSSGGEAEPRGGLVHSLIHSRPLVFPDRQGNRLVADLSVVVAWDELEYRCQTRPNSPVPGVGAGSGAGSSAGSGMPSMHHKNMLQLEYYVVVTSRRDIYPQQTVRQGGQDDFLGSYSNYRSKLAEAELLTQRRTILAMLTSAEINCRRDWLWDQLLAWEGEEGAESVSLSTSTKKGKKRDSTEEEEPQMAMSYPEFKVLLGCVHHTPLSDLDPSLDPLLHNSPGWYRDLFRTLRQARRGDPLVTRYITSEDRKIRHLVLLLGDSCNQVVLITTDENTAELELITKELPARMGDNGSGIPPIIHDLETQKQIENIINAIIYHLWTTAF